MSVSVSPCDNCGENTYSEMECVYCGYEVGVEMGKCGICGESVAVTMGVHKQCAEYEQLEIDRVNEARAEAYDRNRAALDEMNRGRPKYEG